MTDTTADLNPEEEEFLALYKKLDAKSTKRREVERCESSPTILCGSKYLSDEENEALKLAAEKSRKSREREANQYADLKKDEPAQKPPTDNPQNQNEPPRHFHQSVFEGIVKQWERTAPRSVTHTAQGIDLETSQGQRVNITNEAITFRGGDPDRDAMKAAVLTAAALWGGEAHVSGGTREQQLKALAHGEAWGVKITTDTPPTPEEREKVSNMARALVVIPSPVPPRSGSDRPIIEKRAL